MGRQNSRVKIISSSTFVLAFLLSILFLGAFAQETDQLQAGVYAGIQLGALKSPYPDSPLPGWKTGLQLTYKLQPRWRLTGEAGASFLSCHVGSPVLPHSVKWKYLWAEVAPLVSFVPIQKHNFQLTIVSGISVRRILTTSVGNSTSASVQDLIFPWTYFFPIRLTGSITLASRHLLAFAAEYSAQLRPMYRSENDNLFTAVNRMYSWGLIVSYSIPRRSTRA
jgi:hypothetical protein